MAGRGVAVTVAAQPVAYRTTDESPDFTSLDEFPNELDADARSRRGEMAGFAVAPVRPACATSARAAASVADHVRAMAKVLGKLPAASASGARAPARRCRRTSTTRTNAASPSRLAEGDVFGVPTGVLSCTTIDRIVADARVYQVVACIAPDMVVSTAGPHDIITALGSDHVAIV